MARGRPRRSWVKMDCYGCLHGSINWELTLEEQAIWFKLIMFCAESGGPEGMISDNDNNPVPHDYIAHELHCPIEVLKSTLAKCQASGRIRENSTGIEIINWNVYQSEYSRQKPYREAKSRQRQEPTLEEVKEINRKNKAGLNRRSEAKAKGL